MRTIRCKALALEENLILPRCARIGTASLAAHAQYLYAFLKDGLISVQDRPCRPAFRRWPLIFLRSLANGKQCFLQAYFALFSYQLEPFITTIAQPPPPTKTLDPFSLQINSRNSFFPVLAQLIDRYVATSDILNRLFIVTLEKDNYIHYCH